MSAKRFIFLLLTITLLTGGSPRRPVVVVNGTLQQTASADYVSTVGGLTTTATAASTGDVQTATETVSSRLTNQGQSVRASTLTIATWASGQTLSDWNPAGLSTAYTISMEQSSGTTNISGILAQPVGTEIVLYCRESSVGGIILQYDTGTVANQIVLPGGASFGFPWQITPGSSVTLRYGGSNWQFVSAGTTFFPYINIKYGAQLGGTTSVGALTYSPQADASTGTVNDFGINSTTTTVLWSGVGSATYTGMTGGADGRTLCVINSSSGQSLTLSNLNGGSLGPRQLQNKGNSDAVLVGAGSAACYIYDGTPYNLWRMTSMVSPQNNAPATYTSSKNRGSITLTAGTGTGTVQAGSVCTCTDATAVAAVKCAVSSTTLTATGTGTDAISYLCF